MSTSSGAGGRVLRAVFSLLVMLGALGAALYIPPQLGLDLSGGTQIVLETHDSDSGVEANAENTEKAVEVLRQRIDSLGVAESTITRSGENRIIVELPGVQDPTEAADILGTTAQLTFHPVVGVADPGAQQPGMPGEELGEGLPPQDEDAPDEDAGDEADEARAPSSPEDEGGEDAPEEGGELTEEQIQELQQLQQEQGGGGMPPAVEPADPEDVELELPDEEGQMLQLGPAEIEGEDVSSAEASLDEFQTAWMVNVSFRGDGRDAWAQLTGEAAAYDPGDPRRRVAIVLDNQVISSPQVNPDVEEGVGITGGSTSITGNFDQESAEDLAVLIEGGALPLPVEQIEQRTVGPTLGADAIDASWKAALVGLALTIIYICFAYRLVGFLASIALACYTLIAYGALVVLGATLTLPGLAGFVLAIGMAIDANVLIFERAREEYQREKQVYDSNKSAGMQDATEEEAEAGEQPGRSRRRRRAIPPNLQRSFVNGTKHAWSAIIDTNITTILAAILLIFLASGPVQGFGWTLTIGTIASMVSALIIARVLTEWAIRRKVVKRHPDITGISQFSRVRTWLVERNPNLMGRGGLWLSIAGVIAAVAIAGIAIMPKNFGVEFTGGRIMDFSVSEEIDVDEARTIVADAGYPQAVVQESGEGDIAVRTGPLDNAEAQEIEDALATEGGDVDRVSDEMIGPSLGDQLRNQALLALGIALAVQMAYLAWRFRWSFGLATMLALGFDVVLVIGLFTFLGAPLDGVFLAAMLSVIGFSVNDSVVVFDRIRDEWAKDDKRSFKDIANSAILHTLPRTVNTTIGAVFILSVLAVFGGESLTNFAVAMLVGLIAGVFSTVFIAAPLAAWLQRWDRTAAPHVIKERQSKRRKEMERTRDEDDGAIV
ncbi:protein translocase subunit SecD [Spiractinospora alimapuensis]|uniref:protein translocase subunit SecD n=1 Tax=Spiractinospora alimapuensis TaxID=2820884 RepID=UPI001F24178C|nr:protein translocase subunit SecD [Spiractinospora alimapuensis]QVQ51388.1 protein translocase subunit SecD [Spiractinospora alimapuensis]